MGYAGAIRNDAKNVMYLPPNSDEEIVLSNFNLEVNDTVSFYTADTARVVSIDSLLVGGNYRRRYNVESIKEIEGWYFYPYSI